MECKGKKVQDTLHILVPYGGPCDRLRFGLHCSSWLPRPLGVIIWSVLHLLLIFEECIRGIIVIFLTATFVVLFLLWKLVLVLGVVLVVPAGMLFYTFVALYRCLVRRPQQWVFSLQELHIEYQSLITDGIDEILGGRFASTIWEGVIVWYTSVRSLMLTEVLHDFDVICI
ncbi:hypothetical protein M758_10G011400 [Ceratodon purpureus]|nr:hypothetical protein M758_10G011400 [Ceratodon purpureus]